MRVTDRQIRWALHKYTPKLYWVVTRNKLPKSSPRIFNAKREGILYTVQVRRWWPVEDLNRIPEYDLFIDNVFVFRMTNCTHEEFASQCSKEILKLAAKASARASNLYSAIGVDKPKTFARVIAKN